MATMPKKLVVQYQVIPDWEWLRCFSAGSALVYGENQADRVGCEEKSPLRSCELYRGWY